MKRIFANGDKEEFKEKIQDKKAVLCLCKTEKSAFGLFISGPFKYWDWTKSPMILAFNLNTRK